MRDLLLFPPTLQEEETAGDINFTDIDYPVKDDPYNILYIFIIALAIIIGIIVIFLRIRKGRRKDHIKEKIIENQNMNIKTPDRQEPPGSPDGQKLPGDLKEILDILINTGGRITQKDLRKKTRYSEAKVSLMIADLESRGLVTKIKKGRGNIITVKKENP